MSSGGTGKENWFQELSGNRKLYVSGVHGLGKEV